MNSKIDYLISEIRFAIPPEILDYAFRTPTSFNNLAPSIDYELRNKIIDGKVLRDCNVVGGIEVHVDMQGCTQRDYPGGTLIIVPPSQTGGKNITAVFNVAFNMGSYYQANSGNDIVNAVDGPTQLSSHRIQLVGPNTLYFEGGIISTMRFIRCIVENDAEFANINDRSLPFLSEMCVLATKAYIYNMFSIKAENMPIIQGLPMGKLADMISEYSDAAEMYTELRRTKLRKVLLLNDRTSHSKYIRMRLFK